MQRMNAFAVAPAGIAALSSVEKYVQSSGLDPKLIALTKIRVSQMNGCAYCLHMQTEEAHELGESSMRLYLLDAWRESNLYSQGERAALAWAETLTKIAATHAPDDAYEGAREQFSEKELADLSISNCDDKRLEPPLHRRARGAPVRFGGSGLTDWQARHRPR